MIRHATFALLAVLAGVGTAALAGCGDSRAPSSAARARGYAISELRARAERADRAPAAYRRLDELLGNTVYSTDGRPATPLTDAVVRGTVVDVDPGYGFVAAEGAPAGAEIVGDGAKVGFDDPRAVWRTQHLSVRVDEVLSGDATAGQVIRVGLAVGGSADTDASKLSQGLRSLGEAVWFLRKDSPVFAYDPTLFADVEDGGMIAVVDDSGDLTLPFADPAWAERLTRDAPTLGTLRSAARRPRRVVRFEPATVG